MRVGKQWTRQRLLYLTVGVIICAIGLALIVLP
jgi:hypothetical protein